MSKAKKITFHDGDGPFLTIKSEWQSKISTSSSMCQTEEVKYEDSQFQTGLIIPNARVRTIKIKQLVFIFFKYVVRLKRKVVRKQKVRKNHRR